MKRLKIFIKKLLVLAFVLVPITNANNFNAQENNTLASDSEIIIVEIILGFPSTDELEQLVLDDGTLLGDYNYTVIMNSNQLVGPLAYDSLGNYFNYAAWIYRDEGVSPSLDPNDYVRAMSGWANNAWAALSHPQIGFGSDYRFASNPNGMKDQYYCHWYYAAEKDYWNLEPWRPNVGFPVTVANWCNPK